VVSVAVRDPWLAFGAILLIAVVPFTRSVLSSTAFVLFLIRHSRL
jgi:hypothetical protein